MKKKMKFSEIIKNESINPFKILSVGDNLMTILRQKKSNTFPWYP